MTTSAYSWGGVGDDLIVGVDIDSAGNTYAVGNTISTDYTSYPSDIFVFKLDYELVIDWGRAWGSLKSEYATSISVDDSDTYFYICGRSNSVAFIYKLEDMFIVKMDTDQGTVKWAVRVGYDKVDYANSIYYYNS